MLARAFLRRRQQLGGRKARTGEAPNLSKKGSRDAYYTRSKNACSQGHFYDAVNSSAGAKRVRAKPRTFQRKVRGMRIIPGVKMLARKGIFATPSIAWRAQSAYGRSPEPFKERFAERIITYIPPEYYTKLQNMPHLFLSYSLRS